METKADQGPLLQHELHQLLILIMDANDTTHYDVAVHCHGMFEFPCLVYDMTRTCVICCENARGGI